MCSSCARVIAAANKFADKLFFYSTFGGNNSKMLQEEMRFGDTNHHSVTTAAAASIKRTLQLPQGPHRHCAHFGRCAHLGGSKTA